MGGRSVTIRNMKNRFNFRVNVLLLLIASIGLVGVMSLAGRGQAQAQGIPAAPYLFAGDASVAGNTAPDGMLVTARIGEYESEPSLIENGRYALLTVSPDLDDSRDLQNLPIHFYLDGVKASESVIYKLAGLPVIDLKFNLTFPNLPVPTPTPTPEPVLPAVYSGAITVTGGLVPADAVLVAMIGGYTSPPAVIQGDKYLSLVVDPNEPGLRGEIIRFVLNGVTGVRTDSYVSGSFVRDFDLVFGQLPTPTPVPATVTPVPPPTPTPTMVPPTATPARETPTSVPATATVAPKATRLPATPLPPTPLPPTNTPTVAPTITSTPQPAESTAKSMIPAVVSAVVVSNDQGASEVDGDCAMAPGGSGGSGAENALLLLAPLGLAAGLRRRNKKDPCEKS